MKVLDGTEIKKLGQVIRTCSIGNIRLEKAGRLPRTVIVDGLKYALGAIEKDGEIIAEGFIGELLMWDTDLQPFSLDGIKDVKDPTVNPWQKYKCLGRWFRYHR